MSSRKNGRKFSSAPLMWASAAFAVGIAAVRSAEMVEPLSVAAAAVVVAAILFITAGTRSAAILLLFSALGGYSMFAETRMASGPERLSVLLETGAIPADTPIEIEALLADKPEPAHNGVILTLDTRLAKFGDRSISLSGRLRLFAAAEGNEAEADLHSLRLNYGSRIRVVCRPQRDERFLNPGVLSRKEILRMQDVDASAFVKSPLLIEKISDEAAFTPLLFVFDVRQKLIDEFRLRFSPSTAGVMIASLLGNKHFLDRGTAEVFREGGTFHILVISGLHITFIGGLAVLFVRIFTRDRRWQFAAACGFLWAFTAAVGAEAPVVRASIMFTVLMASRVIFRDASLVNSLGACCLLLLVWRPSDLFDPSFQLTVVSVAAIVCAAFPLIAKMRAVGEWMPTADEPFPPNVGPRLRRFCEALYWRESVWRFTSVRQIWSAGIIKSKVPNWLAAGTRRPFTVYILEGIVVSAVVQIFLLPFLVIYFHRFSPAAVVLNLWVGVAIAVESFAALAAVLSAQVSGPVAAVFVMIAEAAGHLLVSVPAFLIENGVESLRIPVYSGAMRAVYFVYFIPVAALTWFVYSIDPFALKGPGKGVRRAVKASAAAGIIAAAVIIWHPFSAPSANGKLRVDFLDVGQGDAALVTFPNGETMLIDGGGRFDLRADGDVFEPDAPRIGEAVVSEFLWEKGYSHVDTVVATHADADHIQGLADIANNFSIGRAFADRAAADNEEAYEFFEGLRQNAIPVFEPSGAIEIGGALVEFLHPGSNAPAELSDNDRSLVIKITFGEHAFLFTGDIEFAAEAILLKGERPLNADVVKVPHHGSRTSSTQRLIDAANASFAVIPVGRRSIFGHPHAEVVERWRISGAEVLRTGDNGTITFVSDGRALTVKTFLAPD